MKIAVLGATGPTGQEFIKQALEDGHEITALARRPEALQAFEGIRVITGNALVQEDIDTALAGQDAVFSSLGLSAAGSNDEVVTVCTIAIGHTLDAMARFGVSNAVVVSTHGVGDSHDDSDYVVRLWNIMGERLRDKETMEAVLADSPLTWTVVRAPRISEGPGTHRYRVGHLIRVAADGHIPRPDLAAFALAEVTMPQFTHQLLSISV